MIVISERRLLRPTFLTATLVNSNTRAPHVAFASSQFIPELIQSEAFAEDIDMKLVLYLPQTVHGLKIWPVQGGQNGQNHRRSGQ